MFVEFVGIFISFQLSSIVSVCWHSHSLYILKFKLPCECTNKSRYWYFFSKDAIAENFPPRLPVVRLLNEQCPEYDQSNGRYIQVAKIAADPRVIKTHLPLTLLSETALSKAKVWKLFSFLLQSYGLIEGKGPRKMSKFLNLFFFC